MALFTKTIWLLATAAAVVQGQTHIDAALFVNDKCTIPSTSTPNASIPLDACIRTIGMQGYIVPVTACLEGGLPSMRTWAFQDGSCGNKMLYFLYDRSTCNRPSTSGDAIGSIMLTCRDSGYDPPRPQGATVTFQVGPGATGAPTSDSSSNSTGSTGSTTGSTGSGTSNNSSNSQTCAGWSCLSTGIKAAIIIGIICGFLLLLFVGGRFWRRGRGRPASHPPSAPFIGGPPSVPSYINTSQLPPQYGSPMGQGYPLLHPSNHSSPTPVSSHYSSPTPISMHYSSPAPISPHNSLSTPAPTNYSSPTPAPSQRQGSPPLYGPQPRYGPTRSIIEEMYAQQWEAQRMNARSSSQRSTTPDPTGPQRPRPLSPNSGYASQVTPSSVYSD